MADHFLADAIGYIHRTLAIAAEPTDDRRLLERFVRDRDEAAFADLVARHGPLVWAACRRGAPTAADAEDAFQATFLVLARRAGRVRRAASVGGWLFRVAVRLAARMQARGGRPDAADRPISDPTPDPADRAAWRDLVSVLDAELAALPDAVRAALVCCYYEGLTQDEAARRLGWKARTVRARVARGRTILRTRLARRGVDLGAALAAAGVGTAAAVGPPAVGALLSPGGPVVGPPAVAELVRDGLALTTHAVPLRLAVAAAVVVAAGVGYAFVVGPGPAPAGGVGGPPVAATPPAGGPESPTVPKAIVDPVAVYNRAVDACVYIVSETNEGTIEGTGILIDRDKRLVLTTCRVVGDGDIVSVQFPYHNLDGTVETDRTDYARSAAARLTPMGRVIHRDKARDLALVQLDRLGRDAHPLELAEAGTRETVLHIGAGTGKLFPMTVRKVVQVDALDVTVPVTTTAEQVKAPTMTLSGATDDSGGPLVDREGKLVGVVVGVAAGPADRNLTLAIGIAEVRAFLADKDKEIPVPPAVPAPSDLNPPAGAAAVDIGPPVDSEYLYDKVVNSCVFIVTPLKGTFVTGSGSLIDAEKRYAITNYHVVQDTDFVFAQFPMYQKGKLITDKKTYIENVPVGKAIKAKVLHRDRSRDLAVIQLEKIPPGTKAIVLAKESPRVGTTTWTIGSPGAVEQLFSITEGKVRAVGVEEHPVGGAGGVFTLKAKLVTATNPVNPGDSGGPLFNKKGELVAVTESGLRRAQAVSLFIDIIEVRAFLNEKMLKITELGIEPKQDKVVPKKDGPSEIPPAKDKDAKPAASEAEEKTAADLLKRCGVFANDPDFKDYYMKRLQEMIKKYPGTAAAKEAQKMLDALK